MICRATLVASNARQGAVAKPAPFQSDSWKGIQMQSTTKKKLAAALAAGAVTVGGAGVAFAYFTAPSASDSGSASVGSTAAWGVDASVDSDSTDLYPGAGQTNVSYTVTNNGGGHQWLASAGLSIDDDGAGNVLDANNLTAGEPTAVDGCLASWFVVDNDGAPAAQDIANAGTANGSASITMTNLTDTSQDACKGVAPAFTVTASSV